MKKTFKMVFILFTVFLFSNLFISSSDISTNKIDTIGNDELTIDPQATLTGISIRILHAYYYDLDNDRRADDVLTIVRINTRSGKVEYVVVNLYQYLTLPSGLTYYFGIVIKGWYKEVTITAQWFNVAQESGWYKFRAYAEAFSYTWYCVVQATVIFDPPEEGPEGAMPRVGISIS